MSTEDRELEPNVKRGLAWTGAAGSLVGAFDVIGTVVVLAFWLTPHDYGIVALALSLLPLADMCVDCGLSSAVIHHDDHDPGKLATVVWLQAGIGACLFLAFAFVIGPGMSRLYDLEVLAAMIAVYGASLPWKAVYLVPRALMLRDLRFGEVAAVRTVANFADLASKIGFAAAGFGPWCFVAGPICRELTWGIGIQLRRPHRPRLMWRLEQTRDWLRYGVERSAALGLYHFYSNVDYHVVGYCFGAAATGLYRLAYELVLEPCRVVAAVTSQVAFPAFARLKNEPKRLVAQLVMVTKVNAFVVIGILALVVVGAEPLIETFWGVEWVAAAGLARILAGVAVLRAFGYVLPALLNALGRTDLTLRYSLVAALLLPGLFGLAGALGQGAESVAWAWLVGYPVAFAVLVRYALASVKITLGEYVYSVRHVVAAGVLAAASGGATAMLVGELSSPVALAVVSTACVGPFVVAIARWEKTSPRALMRSLRSTA